MTTDRQLTAIDLFSGPGGVTTGYQSVGISVLAAVDSDLVSRETYAANHPDIRLLGDDIMTLDPRHLLEETGLGPGELDILTACAPCQTYSTLSSRHRKSNDPRNNLVERVADFVDVLTPRAVVMENVPQLQHSDEFTRLLARLRTAGYGAWFGVVNAADFGVPQNRRRLVLVAIKGVGDKDVPALSDRYRLLVRRARRRTVRQTFALVERFAPADELQRPRANLPRLVAQRIAAIPKNGGSRDMLPAELQLGCHQKLERGLNSAAGNVYGRMKWDDVAPTLTTRCTTPACGRFLHPEEDRPITLREAAALQTFPLNYLFKGRVMAVQAQIGNAVPPKLAQAIAIVVANVLQPTRSSDATAIVA